MHGVDLLLLAFKGIALASLPLALIWIGGAPAADGDRLRRLAWVTAFMTFDLIVFGAFTRLTDSGLGCPDWPGCYAKANPFMAAGDIRNAEAAMPFGPVTMNKAWIEMIHRYLAMAVGLLIVAMLIISVRRVIASRHAVPADRRLPARPGVAASLLGLVVVQGAFGAWTVTQKLQPIFVTMHLLLGMALLGSLVWHASLLERSGSAPPRGASGASLTAPRALALLALAVLLIQIALGGWVSANYAVLACNDFPTCQGAWVPPMDFAQGFDPWRHLGRTADGGSLSLAALTSIQWLHRTFAWLVFTIGAVLAWQLRRAGIVRPAIALAALLGAQFATGLVSVIFSWPLVAAVLHNAGAAALLATLVVINYRVASSAIRRPQASAPRAAGRSTPRPAGLPADVRR